ncbi:Kinesin light chain 3 [Chytriomyces hyalinus]|nr:Kinesin light chain 3 [Chytriomyces hyalinus]
MIVTEPPEVVGNHGGVETARERNLDEEQNLALQPRKLSSARSRPKTAGSILTRIKNLSKDAPDYVSLTGIEFRRNKVVESLNKKLVETKRSETEHMNRLLLMRLTNPWSEVKNSEILGTEMAWNAVQGEYSLLNNSQCRPKSAPPVSSRASKAKHKTNSQPPKPPILTRRDIYFSQLAKPRNPTISVPETPALSAPRATPDLARIARLATPRVAKKIAWTDPRPKKESDPIAFARLTRVPERQVAKAPSIAPQKPPSAKKKISSGKAKNEILQRDSFIDTADEHSTLEFSDGTREGFSVAKEALSGDVGVSDVPLSRQKGWNENTELLIKVSRADSMGSSLSDMDHREQQSEPGSLPHRPVTRKKSPLQTGEGMENELKQDPDLAIQDSLQIPKDPALIASDIDGGEDINAAAELSFAPSHNLPLHKVYNASNKEHTKAAIRLQSMFRGHTQRKRMSIINAFRQSDATRWEGSPAATPMTGEAPGGGLDLFRSSVSANIDSIVCDDIGEGNLADPNTFSTNGLPFSHFLNLIELWGGHEALRGKTTTEVCNLHLKPMTMQTGLSLCAHYSLQQDTSYLPRKAAWFISHAWQFPFLDVIDGISNFLIDRDLAPEDAFIWFDLFSNSQHNAESKPFVWWETTFMNAIKKIGNVVMVLQPWLNPLPLKRTWCVFELLVCIKMGCKFHITLTTGEKSDFLNAILSDAKKFHTILANTSCIRSEAFKMTDKKSIFRVIRSTVGFAKLDQLVFDTFSGWVVDQFKRNIFLNGSNPILCAQWQCGLADFYELMEKFDLAEPLLVEAHNAQMKALGNHHPDTLLTLNALGSLYVRQERFFEAEVSLRQAHDAQLEQLGENHVETIQTLLSLANLSKSMGHYDEAEAQYQKALDLQMLIYTPEDQHLLNTRSNLATLFVQQGRYNEAGQIYKSCLDANMESLGVDHPDTLTTLSSFVNLLYLQGELEEARKLCEECYSSQLRLFGTEHLGTLVTMNTFGLILTRLEEYREAEEILTKCLEGQRKISGPDHSETLTVLSNLASCYASQSLFRKAETAYVECLHTQRRTLSPDHPSVLQSIYSLSSLFIHQSRFKEAAPLLKQCLEDQKRVLGENHLSTLRSVHSLAILELKSGNLKEAERLLLRYVDGRGNASCESLETLEVYGNLGFICDQQARFDSAEKLYLKYYDGYMQRFGEEHPNSLVAGNNLGMIYFKKGNLHHAEPLFLRCVEEFEKGANMKLMDALTATNNLALVYFYQERFVESEKLFRQVLDAQACVFGSDSLASIPTSMNLVHLLVNQGKIDEAYRFSQQSAQVSLKNLGSAHPDTQSTISALADIFEKLGRTEEENSLRSLISPANESN